MNEKVILLLLLVFNNNKAKKLQSDLAPIKDYLESLEVDKPYSLEKIHIAQNISPFIPEELSTSYNKAIMISKLIVKVEELKELTSKKPIQTNELVHFDNNAERIQKIVSVLQNETSKDSIKNMGIIMDLILNMEKYKKMYSLLNTFMKNKDNTNGIEDILKIASPLLEASSSKGKNEDNSIEKMLDIVKLLNSKNTDANKNTANEGA